MMKAGKWILLLRSVAFLLIFCLLLTIVTLFYLPKRDGNVDQSAQPAGFYLEPENTIDVLGLGSCNLYSSFSPVLMYEKYGVTGYNFCCPDEELSTSYYYLREALKTQSPKVVMIESLFLTNTNSAKREHYNRLAFDYFPLNANKLKLAWETSRRESELMKKYDPTAPDFLLTFAGYVFPLLRYHSRTDLGGNDISFFFKTDLYNYYKGGFPQYSYTRNDGNFFDKVFNGNEINEMSRKYVPMIQELCEEKGIKLIILKSPNYARWGYDDVHTKIVRDFAGELGIPFIDFMAEENNNFEEFDYGIATGRLNIYGIRKLSDTLGAYITEELGIGPTVLSPQDQASWQECVRVLYERSKENDCNLYPGQLAQLSCRDDAIRVRWNPYEDCSAYSIYRCPGKGDNFQKIAEHISGEYYDDYDVSSLCGYSYYIVPEEGASAGTSSDTQYYVYVDMPENFSVSNVDGKAHLSWEEVDGAYLYRIFRRNAEDFNYSWYVSPHEAEYTDMNAILGKLVYYRLVVVYKEDGLEYTSMSTIDRAVAQATPQITKITSGSTVTISWNKLTNQDEIQIWRRTSDDDDYRLLDTVSGTETSYTDETVESGKEYYYQIVSFDTEYGYSAYSDSSNTVSAKTSF